MENEKSMSQSVKHFFYRATGTIVWSVLYSALWGYICYLLFFILPFPLVLFGVWENKISTYVGLISVTCSWSLPLFLSCWLMFGRRFPLVGSDPFLVITFLLFFSVLVDVREEKVSAGSPSCYLFPFFHEEWLFVSRNLLTIVKMFAGPGRLWGRYRGGRNVAGY